MGKTFDPPWKGEHRLAPWNSQNHTKIQQPPGIWDYFIPLMPEQMTIKLQTEMKRESEGFLKHKAQPSFKTYIQNRVTALY